MKRSYFVPTLPGHSPRLQGLRTAVLSTAFVVVGASPASASIYDPSWLNFSEATGNPPVLGGDLDSDWFGSAFTTGDFDDDGHLDLAIGHRYETIGGVPLAGAVTVVQGVSSGWLDLTDSWRLHHDLPGVPAVPMTAEFGGAIAAGDLDRDGYDDLAVGARIDDGGRGSVTVFFGSPNGFIDPIVLDEHSPTVGTENTADGLFFGTSVAIGRLDDFQGAELIVGAIGDTVNGQKSGSVSVIGFNGRLPIMGRRIHRGGGGLPGAPANDSVGSAVAVGRINGDSLDDLAIGASNADDSLGVVYLVAGSSSFFSGVSATMLTQADGGGTREPGDYFGSELALGNFDGKAYDDLAVGVPSEEVHGAIGAGAVNVIYLNGLATVGGASAFTPIGGQQFHQNQSQVAGVADAGDAFGRSIAAGDLDGDGNDDLAIGVHHESVFEGGSNKVKAGAVVTLVGIEQGLSGLSSRQIDRPDPGVPGLAQTHDYFGYAVAIDHFDGDRRAELVIGSPGRKIGSVWSAGDVTIL